MKEIRWFLGENNTEVFAVYKACFEGTTITDEYLWFLSTGDAWTSTRNVSDWYWIGKETVWPCSQAEAEKYLPDVAIQQIPLKSILIVVQ